MLLYKSSHIIYPDKGIYAKQWTFKTFVYKTKHIINPFTIHPPAIKHLKYGYKKAHTLPWHWDICETVNIWNIAT